MLILLLVVFVNICFFLHYILLFLLLLFIRKLLSIFLDLECLEEYVDVFVVFVRETRAYLIKSRRELRWSRKAVFKIYLK